MFLSNAPNSGLLDYFSAVFGEMPSYHALSANSFSAGVIETMGLLKSTIVAGLPLNVRPNLLAWLNSLRFLCTPVFVRQAINFVLVTASPGRLGTPLSGETLHIASRTSCAAVRSSRSARALRDAHFFSPIH